MKKLMFKLTVYLFIIASLVMTYPIETSASTSFNNYDIETLENGYYYETIIEEKESPNTIIPTGAVKYITQTSHTKNGIRTLKNQYFSSQISILMLA